MKIILAGVNALLLIIIVVCLFQIRDYSRALLSQQAADSWKGQSELRFAQVSAFLPVDKTADENSVYSFRMGLDSKLKDAGVENPETGSLWTDAYSGSGSLKVKGEKGTFDATVIGVGGDFFLFHPYELRSGGYISEDDLMQDRVVLDYELAWKLFGGSDLAGMSVEIGGKPYYVAGVIKREADKFSETAFSGEPAIFMSYSAASEIIEDFGIDCYELVMPDPISGFVGNIVSESFFSGSAVVVQNTGRYSFGRIIDIFEDFGSRSVMDSGVIYPYWENAARISEDYIARLYAVIAVLAFIPLICLIWLAVKLVIFIIKMIRFGWAQGKEAWDDRYARIDEVKQKARGREANGGGKKQKRARANEVRTHDGEPSAASPSESGSVFDEKEVALDIESIVREIMEENK